MFAYGEVIRVTNDKHGSTVMARRPDALDWHLKMLVWETSKGYLDNWIERVSWVYLRGYLTPYQEKTLWQNLDT